MRLRTRLRLTHRSFAPRPPCATWLWPLGKNCISGGTNFRRMRLFRVGRETNNAPGHRPVLESILDLLDARHGPTPHRRCPGFPAGLLCVGRWGTTPRTAGALPSYLLSFAFKLASNLRRDVTGRRLPYLNGPRTRCRGIVDHHPITVALKLDPVVPGHFNSMPVGRRAPRSPARHHPPAKR